MARDRRGRAIPATIEKQQDEFKTYADVRAMTSYSMQILLHCLASLRSLRTKYIVSGFSILSFGILVDGSKRAGLSWDSLISCEFLGYYKPDPNSYKKAAELLGLKPSEVMMVAAHKSDLGAAMSAGFLAAYTPRPLEYGALDDRDLSPEPDFAVNAKDFIELA